MDVHTAPHHGSHTCPDVWHESTDVCPPHLCGWWSSPMLHRTSGQTWLLYVCDFILWCLFLELSGHKPVDGLPSGWKIEPSVRKSFFGALNINCTAKFGSQKGGSCEPPLWANLTCVGAPEENLHWSSALTPPGCSWGLTPRPSSCEAGDGVSHLTKMASLTLRSVCLLFILTLLRGRWTALALWCKACVCVAVVWCFSSSEHWSVTPALALALGV